MEEKIVWLRYVPDNGNSYRPKEDGDYLVAGTTIEKGGYKKVMRIAFWSNSGGWSGWLQDTVVKFYAVLPKGPNN